MVHMSLTSTDRETFTAVLLVPYKKVTNCTQFYFEIYFDYFIIFVQKMHNIFDKNYLFLIAILHVSMYVMYAKVTHK